MGRSTLIIVLGFIVIFSGVITQMNRISERANENSVDYAENIIARQISLGGMEYLISRHSLTGISDTILTEAVSNTGSFTGSITTISYDTLSKFFDISFDVTASAGDVIHASKVTLKSRILLVPVIPATVGALANTVLLDIIGNARIYGQDTNIDGTTGTSGDLPGITVSEESDSTNLADQYEGTTKIQGEGSTPSIAVFDDITKEDMDALIDAYISVADYNLSSCSSIGNKTLGSVESPVVVYIDGSCTIAGNLTGYGVLITENVTFKGRVKWYGLVLVSGEESANVTSLGNSSIHGALLVSAPIVNISIKGTDQFYYSNEAIEMLTDHFSEAGKSPRIISQILWWD